MGPAVLFRAIIKAAHLDLQVVVYIESMLRLKLYSVMTEAGIDIERVALVIVELDSVWMRDFGPLVVKDTDGAYRIMDLRYFWGPLLMTCFQPMLAHHGR